MSDNKNLASTNEPSMSKEDIAYFIRTMWEALLKPDWIRGDLIDLGMAVFSKTTLSQLDQKKLNRLLPNLSIVAGEMGKHIQTRFSAEYEAILSAQEVAHQVALEDAKSAYEKLLRSQQTAHQAALEVAKSTDSVACKAPPASTAATTVNSAEQHSPDLSQTRQPEQTTQDPGGEPNGY